MSRLLTSFVIALALAKSYDTALAQGVFTDSACPCTLFEPAPSSKCITPVQGIEGKCHEGPCRAHFKCDMSGAYMCSRSKCPTWAHSTKAKASPEEADAFDCEKTAILEDCATEDPSIRMEATTKPTQKCIYNKDECSCIETTSTDLCVKFDSILEGKSQCKLTECGSGFKCDCLSPTHLCKRSQCSMFTANKLQKEGSFPCLSTTAECAKAERAL